MRAFDVVVVRDRIAEIVAIAPRGRSCRRGGPRRATADRGTGFTLMPGFVVLTSTCTRSTARACPGIRAQAVDGAWRDQRARAGQWPPDRVAGRRQAAQQRGSSPRASTSIRSSTPSSPGSNADTARQAVRNARRRGADGIKFIGSIRRTCSPPWTRPRQRCAPRCTTPSSWWRTPTCCNLGARPRLDGALVRPARGHVHRPPAAALAGGFNNTDEQMRFAGAGGCGNRRPSRARRAGTR